MTVPESIHPAAEMICVSLHLQMHFRISDYVMLLFCVLLHTGHSQMHTVTQFVSFGEFETTAFSCINVARFMLHDRALQFLK